MNNNYKNLVGKQIQILSTGEVVTIQDVYFEYCGLSYKEPCFKFSNGKSYVYKSRYLKPIDWAPEDYFNEDTIEKINTK